MHRSTHEPGSGLEAMVEMSERLHGVSCSWWQGGGFQMVSSVAAVGLGCRKAHGDLADDDSIDTQHDLQSCGGCFSQGKGEDCTVFDDMASASCVAGKCQCECQAV
jgi:hypothetical protein